MAASSTHLRPSHIIKTEAQLRALIGEPAELTCAKISNRLNAMTRIFIERSPFVCVATSDPAGNCDLSPRGDPAGFLRILDERTLLLPERPGNRLADSLVDRTDEGRHLGGGSFKADRLRRRRISKGRDVEPASSRTGRSASAG